MKPAPFEYYVPDSLQEALELLKEHGEGAKVLAGGQSLVPTMNFRVVQPAVLIDLNRISELVYLGENHGALQIGAMVTERRLEFDPLVSKRTPLLTEAMPHVAHPQIRNRGTLGGSLANADPAAELPVITTALEARFLARGMNGERWVEAQDFFVGMFTTALAPDEILVGVELPVQAPRTGWSFLEFAPRPGDYALMGIAALLALDESGRCEAAKLIYLNAGEGPVPAPEAARLLIGERIREEVIVAAADLASAKELSPFGNIHASSEFQRHLANVLTQRALAKALRRAGEHLE